MYNLFYLANENNIKIRAQSSLLTLRKNQLEEFIMSRRRLLDDDRNSHIYKIDIRVLNVPDNLKFDEYKYKTFKCHEIISQYLMSNVVDILKYGLFILRNYVNLEKNDLNLSEFLNEPFFVDILCNLILHPDFSIRVKVYLFSLKVHGYSLTPCITQN